MFKIVTGYWGSQIAGAMARLGIADCLADSAQKAASIATQTGCDEQGIRRLMRGAVALGVSVQVEPGKFALTSLGRTLTSAAPDSMRDMAAALTAPGHWLPWGMLDAAVQKNERQTTAALGVEIFDYFAAHPVEGRAFNGAMANLSSLEAEAVAAALDTRGVRYVVDVGGGLGTIVAALMTRNKELCGAVLELPEVAAAARSEIARMGLTQRCEVIEGDIFRSVPEADLYILKNVLHDWDDERCVRVLTNCVKSMRKDGRVILVEAVLAEDGSPGLAPFLDLVMLVLTPGRERTAQEYRELLNAAGLRSSRIIPTHSPMQLIEATENRDAN